MARKLLNFLEGLFNTAVMIAVVVMGAYAGYALWDNQQIYSAAENVQAELLLYKEKAESQTSLFEELRAINPDVCAWLTLDETKIDYPIVQGTTNFTYLNTDVYGNFSMAGSIFADSRNDRNFRDHYTLVHGHHMSERRMFGDLDLYKDKTFFDTNKTGILILEDRTYQLRTFACLLVESSDPYIFVPEQWQDKNMETLFAYSEDYALNWDKKTIERLIAEKVAAKEGGKHPQILSLATCSGESEAARTILLAEMIPYEPAENGEEEP